MTGNTGEPRRGPTDKFETALEALSDDYTCRILTELQSGPKPAVELANRCDMSRPTVYRRLNRLEELGFVTSRERREACGTPRKQFRLTLEEIQLDVREQRVSNHVSRSAVETR